MRTTGEEKRRFERRASSIGAFAVLPGQVQLPCIIDNISDGGALLVFTGGAAPTQSFRLQVEGTGFNLLCEIRHRRGRSVGIRFVRLTDGIALNRHFQTSISDAGSGDATPPVRRAMRPTARPGSVRELRRTVMAMRIIADTRVAIAPLMAPSSQMSGEAHADKTAAVDPFANGTAVSPNAATENPASSCAAYPPSFLMRAASPDAAATTASASRP